MKVSIVIVVALLLSACTRSESSQSATASTNVNSSKPTKVIKFTKTYTGAINKQYAIEMTLMRDGDNLLGTYFYTNHRQDITLKGTVDNHDKFTLDEFDASGNKTGAFTGEFVTGEYIEGQWSKAGGQPMPFTLETGHTPEQAASTPGEQAIVEVQKVFENTAFTRCGDSYYSLDNALGATYGGGMATGIAQRQNPRYEVETTYPITEADKLNGITWKGTVILKFDAIRYYANGGWVDWRPYQPLKMYELTANLRNGKWLTEAPSSISHAQNKVSCSEVPK